MRKVLIISYFFPPANCIASQRFGTMCRYFEEYGYEPYILTTASLSQTYMKVDLKKYIPENRIIRIGRLGYPYVCTSILTTMICQYIEKRGLHTNTLLYSSMGWYEKVKRELDWSLLEDIDIVVGSFPPIAPLLLAKYISDKIHCPYIVDMRDAITEYPDYIGSHKNCCMLDSAMERYIYKDAVVIIPAGREFCQQLKKRYPRKVFKVVYNGWDEYEGDNTDTFTEGKYLYYAGTIYEHCFECLKLIFSALKNVGDNSDIKMYIRSTSSKEIDHQIKCLIEEAGLQERVFLMSAADRGIVDTEQKRAYINVVLNTVCEDNEYMMSAVTGKIFENIQAPPPVLAISPKGSTIAKILDRTEKGISVNSVSEIEAFIRNPHGHNGKKSAINFFSRKNQAHIYCNIMNDILEGKLR